jgi:hypothetical protein
MQNRAQLVQFGIATAVGLAGLFVNPGNWSSPQNASLTTQAQAEIGRPLTPGSIAGVNRRVHRRAARRAYYGYGYGAGGYYGAYGGYPSAYYRGYGAYAAYPGYYGAYGSYPGGYYGGYANRSYVTGRPTVLPRYNTGWAYR